MPLDNPVGSRLEDRLRREMRSEVLFDAFSRGRYSTDASIYQIEPLGVVVPKSREDAVTAIAIAREEGVPVLPRGAGTSLAGGCLPVGGGVMIALTRMKRILEVDYRNRYAVVPARRPNETKILFPSQYGTYILFWNG